MNENINDKAKKDVLNGVGTKDDHNKLDITLIDPEFIIGVCQVLDVGLKKYERGNWQKSLDPRRILSASLRHELKLLSGELIDPESGLHHSLHIACNQMFLYYYHRKGIDIKPEHLTKVKKS